MFLTVALFIVGIVLVLFGADKLVSGAICWARKCHVAEMAIGLTLVAFGTSLPEFATCLTAVGTGHADMAAGNLVGSNIFNVLAVVGCAALCSPIAVSKSTVSKDIPFALCATLALMVASSDALLDGATGGNTLSRTDGLLLLGFFVAFMAYTVVAAGRHPQERETADVAQPAAKAGARIAVAIALGLVALVAGALLFVDSASQLAAATGISESRMGLTAMAMATSFPELATSIVAARRGSSSIAIGNVVGSNVFNIFLVAGCCATLSPMPMGGILPFDWIVMLSGLLLLWYFSSTRHVVERWEGGVLMAVYLVYLARLVWQTWG